ncbi:hypothetical protein KU73_23335 [Pectobacterium wasabiae]|uniref:Uncharacterized protein n=1 Tax=Pectobacterium wasabiae TaxID=55208 RepID=A0AAW3EBQ6_9GAMM|nr:hypothetical protein A7983_09050 [Pectobacterium wasabiae CFBP 3304]EJS94559.1 Hypothetical protein Y17_2197 [Pectobacterium wasabiae CFBP 3304]KFW98799.1 hypothetical protein JV38_23340 [Pectobacterium wasabiae]KGA26062.1 hypothetical protein KU73_23335 [Pectobacterium wasabiae]
MNMQNLKLIIFNSLLGNVNKKVRSLAYDYYHNKIIIYGYLDAEPDDDDYEAIDIAISEIMSSCPNLEYQEINLVKSCDPIGTLNPYKGWVFVRREN